MDLKISLVDHIVSDLYLRLFKSNYPFFNYAYNNHNMQFKKLDFILDTLYCLHNILFKVKHI